ncbi:hypothetical protein GGR56DRAFT_666744 [Xylariaceae sp. FL0804]|nr:hypothetical protein GGR56DRAFT_666744 [Xylariaceae sp. FL0804]
MFRPAGSEPATYLSRSLPWCYCYGVGAHCSSHAISQTPPKPPSDHRKLGLQQELFITSQYSPGSPILLPNGSRIFNRLVEFLRKQYVRYGFDEVITPTIYKKALWKKSGHLENYGDDMFAVTSTSPARADATEGGEEDEYGLKPMNCPGHCLIFASQRRSYRDLPIRYADFSPLHRNEVSGALSGLTRVRRFHQDDGHIFCRPIQIEEEISKTLDFVRVVYSTFKLGPYRLALSTRPADHYIGTAEEWATAESALKRALDTSGLDWTINEADGAFYGPKIDIILRDSDGKEHQTATIQLDFQLPKRFNLEYTAPAPEMEQLGQTTSDAAKLAEYGLVRPVMIHRAVLGSVERLMALLIEHYDGKWPFWLNPRQPVVAMARSAQDHLMGRDSPVDRPLSASHRISVDIDDSPRSMGTKVREARSKGYGIIVTVGPKQLGTGMVTVSVPDASSGEGVTRASQKEMTPAELLEHLRDTINSADDVPSDPPPDYAASAREHGHHQPLPVRSQPQQSSHSSSSGLPPPPAAATGRKGPPPLPPPGATLDLPILRWMRTHRVILASASPRRRALLAQVGLPGVEVRPCPLPEDLPKESMDAHEYVRATARRKALDVYASAIRDAAAAATSKNERNTPAATDPDLVIAADTVVVARDGAVLEKPSSEAAHRRMLRHLRDTRAHRVLTAVCCVAPRADAQHPGYCTAAAVEETAVVFASAADGLPDDVLDAYVRTREGADKAGGYAVQGLAGLLLVERVEGPVDNVVGLPVRRTLQLCERVVFRQDELTAADGADGDSEQGSDEE